MTRLARAKPSFNLVWSIEVLARWLLVTSSQRASTSMLQTKLKLGFARASRVMDELERYGIIGPQDPRNPATPRQIYGPDNWFRSQDDIDDPGD